MSLSDSARPDNPPAPLYRILTCYRPIDADGHLAGEPVQKSWLSTDENVVTVVDGGPGAVGVEIYRTYEPLDAQAQKQRQLREAFARVVASGMAPEDVQREDVAAELLVNVRTVGRYLKVAGWHHWSDLRRDYVARVGG